MEVLKTIIRNIVVIILLASFLEMLLPSSSMKRYVKLVMGLFIIITLLGPVLTMVDKKYSIELGSYQLNTEGNVNDILNKAKKISDANKQKAKEEYQLILSKQIQGIAQLNDGLKIVDAQIKLKNENQSDIADIDEVTLVVDKESAKTTSKNGQNSNLGNNKEITKESIIKTVQPVKIQIGKSDKDLKEGGNSKDRLSQGEKEKIISTIANIYNLNEKQIKIIEKSN